jgi:hypothetical protein
MNARDPLVRGERLNDQFSYHVLRTTGPEMVHVTRSYRPEVVLFGDEQRFKNPLMLEAGKQIVITTYDDDHVTVSRFALNEPDQKRVVSTKVDDVIRAVVDLGGTYPDVVQALQNAKSSGALNSRFQIDAVPQGGRMYRRKDEAVALDEPEPGNDIVIANPLPDLFTRRGTADEKRSKPERSYPSESDQDEKPSRWRAFLGKMTGRGDDS